jgi:Ca-activated chloride channel family protein
MRLVFACLLCVIVIVAAGIAAAADRAIIVLDASGSMWGQIEGRTKIEIARDTLGEVLQSVPEELELGLYAYGHREKGSCDDIEEIVSAGAGTRQSIADAANSLNPKGKTPLTESVRRAAQSLRFTEEKATVILVTDGIETCDADPCAVAAELEAAGVDFTAHVVGFGLSAEEGRQVACLAENTGGKFIEAKDAGSLADALTQTVVAAGPAPTEEPAPAPQPQPERSEFNYRFTAYLAEGVPLEIRDTRWDCFAADSTSEEVLHYSYTNDVRGRLDPGKYRVRATTDLVTSEFTVELTEDGVAERPVILNAGIVDISVVSSQDGEPDANAYWEAKSGERGDYGYGPATRIVPAGDLPVKARLGRAEAETVASVAAGERKEVRIVAGAGIVSVSATYAEGGPAVEGSDIYFEVLEAKKALDGNRKSVDYGYGAKIEFTVPAGEFMILGRLSEASAETPVTVRAGERSDVVVNLNAGVLAISAPGARFIEILSAKKDLQGNRRSVAYAYGETFQITVAPGEYVVEANYDGDAAKKSANASVSAAVRSEVTVE